MTWWSSNKKARSDVAAVEDDRAPVFGQHAREEVGSDTNSYMRVRLLMGVLPKSTIAEKAE